MKLYHFTSLNHLSAICRYGLTVGDVPTDLYLNKGRCGVWLTSSEQAQGHGLDGIYDKTRFRLTVELPEDARLVRWIEWAPRNATKETICALHATAHNFETWFVFFGAIEPSAIEECFDTRAGAIIPNWRDRKPGPMDAEAIPPEGRARWHKKLLKQVARAVADSSSAPPGLAGFDKPTRARQR